MLPTPDYPDGIDPIDVCRDLRFVKTRQVDRTKILWLIEQYSSRALTYEEAKWIRSVAKRKIIMLTELHASRASVRSTKVKQRIGYKNYDALKEKAARETKLRRLSTLRKAKKALEAAHEETQDFGL